MPYRQPLNEFVVLAPCLKDLVTPGGPRCQLDGQVNVRIDLDEVKARRGAWAYGHARAVSAL